MALYALDDVDDAYAVTRAFLTNIDRTTWLKLALVVLFIGGAGANFSGGNVSAGDPGMEPGTPPADGFPTFDPGPNVWLLVGGIVIAIVTVVLALAFVSAVMEFVFVESLRTEVVSVREYWGRYWRRGARLFGFRTVLNLIVFVPIAVLLIAFLGPLLFDSTLIGASLVLLVALVPAILFLGALVAVVNGLTTDFVVPIMLLEDRGVLDGWKRLWPTIKSQWKQYLAYLVARFVLTLAAGLAVFIVMVLLLGLLLVPFGVLFALGFGLLMVAELAGIAWFVVTGLLFAIAAIAVGALVQVPVQTYLRYYALLVLGDVEESFDLVPEQRTSVRTDADEEA